LPKLNIIQKNIQQVAANLESKLGASPVSPLRIVADGVASSHPDPLRNGTILLHLLGKFSFYAKSFQRGHPVRNVLSI